MRRVCMPSPDHRAPAGASGLELHAGGAHDLGAQFGQAIAKRPAAYPAVIVTSAEKGDGLPELRAEIMRTTGVTL